MLFIVSGRDHENGLAHRLEVRPRHREYYATLGDDLILAGPYLDAEGEPIGSMIVIGATARPMRKPSRQPIPSSPRVCSALIRYGAGTGS